MRDTFGQNGFFIGAVLGLVLGSCLGGSLAMLLHTPSAAGDQVEPVPAAGRNAAQNPTPAQVAESTLAATPTSLAPKTASARDAPAVRVPLQDGLDEIPNSEIPTTVIVAAPVAKSLATAVLTIDVAPLGETSQVVRLVRGETLTLRVTDAALPMSALEIVRDAPGDPTASVWLVDATGIASTGWFVPTKAQEFRSGHVMAPGDYAVKWLQKPARVFRKPFRVVIGEPPTVTIP